MHTKSPTKNPETRNPEKIINREYTDVEQKKISDILTEYVSPAVENDGGKISL